MTAHKPLKTGLSKEKKNMKKSRSNGCNVRNYFFFLMGLEKMYFCVSLQSVPARP